MRFLNKTIRTNHAHVFKQACGLMLSRIEFKKLKERLLKLWAKLNRVPMRDNPSGASTLSGCSSVILDARAVRLL